MADNDLEAFFATLPKTGAFWCTYELLERFSGALMRDRFLLADGSGTTTPTPNGRIGNVLQGKGLGGGGGSPRGFKCELDVTGTRVRVYYGTIGLCVPAEMIVGDTPPCTIVPSGPSGVVCIAVTAGDVGGGVIAAASAEVKCFSAMPADGSPDNTYYQPIGSYNTVDGSLVVATDGDGIGYQTFKLCGGLGGDPEWGPA